MNADRGFLSAYVSRFDFEVDETDFCSKLKFLKQPDFLEDSDPALLLRALHIDLDLIYVPSSESFRIGKWIYELGRGFVNNRYQSPQRFVDICMTPVEEIAKLKELDGTTSPDSIPIYAVDGLPGSGKSALFRALKRAFPQTAELCAEGDPPQRIGTISALWVSINNNFSLLDWIKSTLHELGIFHENKKTIRSLSALLFKTLHRLGVAAILVDELQFASGKESALRVLHQLLAMREFGVMIVFFANSDLLKNIASAPAQLSERIPFMTKTFSPPLREDDKFREILDAQLTLVPFGHAIDLQKESRHIYDMVAGLHRGSARLIEISASETIPAKRKLTMLDLIEAKRSPSFKSMRNHIELLSATVPVDPNRHPELASNNDNFDATRAYKAQMEQQRISDAASLALRMAMSPKEREAWQATSTKILRESGKLPDNVKSLSESKRKRRQKIAPEDLLKNSYASQRIAKFPRQNPDESEKKD